ncbi:MAG: transposase [Planctomycetota bacterium]
MAGIAKEIGGHAIRVGGYYDHAHLLVRIPAKVPVSHFVGQLKASTSKHINQDSSSLVPFRWQDGYGAFTVSPSNVQSVVDYIDRQMEHHSSLSFEDEFTRMLEKHGVE